MPKVPQTVKHHPASLHVELLTSLLRSSKEKLLVKFLAKELACVSSQLAAKLVKEMRLADDTPTALEPKQIVQLAHLVRDVKFSDPPSDCLGPVGEYNLRLGIMKELQPQLVATFADKAGVGSATSSMHADCRCSPSALRFGFRVQRLRGRKGLGRSSNVLPCMSLPMM